jgi:hypothetical protein
LCPNPGSIQDRNGKRHACDYYGQCIRFRFKLSTLDGMISINKEGMMTLGPAFCKKNHMMLRSYELDWGFYKALKIVQIKRLNLIPTEVDTTTLYCTYHSLRRGSLA